MQYTEWEVWKQLTQENELKRHYEHHKRSKLLPLIDHSLQGTWMNGWQR